VQVQLISILIEIFLIGVHLNVSLTTFVDVEAAATFVRKNLQIRELRIVKPTFHKWNRGQVRK
jgi:hypothetical protein